MNTNRKIKKVNGNYFNGMVFLVALLVASIIIVVLGLLGEPSAIWAMDILGIR